MKIHTNNFKNQIKELGRELDSKITYNLNGTDYILSSEDINHVTIVINGGILKSVMKELDVDSNLDIPIGTILNYKFGVKVDNEYEYLNFGNYVVYSSSKNEDTNSYNLVCYDKMLYTMKQNEDLNITYPTTITNYINSLCNKLGLTFANNNEQFANYNRVIEKELYVGLDYTYRDILDELAQVTASTICINTNDELEIRYINNTNDTIDEEYFKDVNVRLGQKYGPINSVVLSRSAGSDNVYLSDEDSIEANGLCEVKIVDNQIMNWNNRSDYLPDILEKLNGLEYYINDFASKGICYYDLCDKYNVKIGENTYNCILFNNEINVTQGLEENIYTDMPEEAKTDYSKSDKTDRRINQAYLIVDKQLKEITSRVEVVEENDETQITDISQLKQTSNSIQLQLSETVLSVGTLQGTVKNMNFNFNTQNLAISSEGSDNKTLINNNGVQVLNKEKLVAIFNNRGGGIDELIVTGTAQIAFTRAEKGTKSHWYNPNFPEEYRNANITSLKYLESNIQSLDDLVGGDNNG